MSRPDGSEVARPKQSRADTCGCALLHYLWRRPASPHDVSHHGRPRARPGCPGATPLLTLTDFFNFRTCAGYAWLVCHQPHQVPEASDPSTRRRDAAEADVRALVHDANCDLVHVLESDPESAAVETAILIEAGAMAIANATVVTARGIVGVANLLRMTERGWELVFIHATSSVKSEHAIEAAFVSRAFVEAGIEVAGVRLIHLCKTYRRGVDLDLDSLLEEVDLAPRVARVTAQVARDVDTALAILGDAGRPGICRCDLGTRNMRCPTFSLFHPTIQGGPTVYDLGGISGRELEDVLARGIVQLVDWPHDIEINVRQQLQIEAVRSGRERIDPQAVGRFLDRLHYPLHFLDYETFQLAVPAFVGCLPWSQIPFQYSVHVLHADGTLDHREFLSTTPRHLPVADLVARLRQDIGAEGSVIVWNQGFEQSRNRDMAEILPEAAPFLHDVSARMVDLMDIVRDGAWVHPAFNGSSSIKKVLPVAAPALSYDQLEIGEGMLAAEQWVQAVMRDPPVMDDNERSAVFMALREYCQRDTLAMVLVLDYVRRMVSAMAS